MPFERPHVSTLLALLALAPAALNTAHGAEFTFSPEVATYVDAAQSATNFESSDLIEIDSAPVKHALLRFGDLPTSDVSKVELVMRCQDGSPKGGDVYLSGDARVESGVTWDTRPYDDGFGGLSLLAERGSVSAGTTYRIDVSDAAESDGSMDDELSLVILPESKNGADYYKNSIELVVTTGGGPPPPPAPPSPTPQPPSGGGEVGPIQFMLYWDEDYFWQEKDDRRRWCVVCDTKGRDCDDEDKVRITKCVDDEKRQWWIRDGLKFRSWTSPNLCIDYRDDENFRTRPCGSSRKQEFRAVPVFKTGRGAELEDAFELHPTVQSGDDKCVTQKHHPKEREILRLQDCSRSRRHDTSLFSAVKPPSWTGHRRLGEGRQW